MSNSRHEGVLLLDNMILSISIEVWYVMAKVVNIRVERSSPLEQAFEVELG